MRSPRAALDLRVLFALVGLVALGSTAMGLVLAAGFHAVGAHHAAGPRLAAPGFAPYGDGAVVVSPPAPRPSANRVQRAAETLTVASQPHPVAAPRAVTPPAPAQPPAAASAPPAANPPLPPASGLDGGGGVQPTDTGGPTTTAHDNCGKGSRHGRGRPTPKPKQAPAAAGLRASGLPSTVEAALAAALAPAEHPDPQDTAKPDGSASSAQTADERSDPEGDQARCGGDDDGDGDASNNGNGHGNGHGDGADVQASGVTVTATAVDALDPLASRPAAAE
jgi:hypothetical protein